MDALVRRYTAALHAIQTGVKISLGRATGNGTRPVPDEHECSPKHLRVGVNSALLDSGALQKVLMDKGIITREEFLEALAELAEADVQSYRERLGFPPNMHLG